MIAQLSSAELSYAIEQIVSSVFENMLGLQVSPCSLAEGQTIPMELHSMVGFSGFCRGVVSIECTRQQAHHFAERFLSLPAQEIQDRIASDVLGEIANMVAGNLKPLFASDIQLSTAKVYPSGTDVPLAFTPEIHKEVAFDCSEGTFVVRLLAATAHS